jgi:phage pi2 protein 07
MNEQIGKLAEQAEEWVCKNYPDAMDDNDEFHAQTMSKFAELIVRECLNIVEPMEDSGDEWCVALKGAAQEIKEHFGVEE